MSRKVFDAWKVEATAKRDECAAGRMTLEEYERWLKTGK